MLQLGRPAVALSPALLLGFALRPVPGPVLQVVASLAMAAIRRRHPGVFERLRDLQDTRFLIDPTDVPVRFLLTVALPTPRLTVLGADGDPAEPVVTTIRGPLPALLDLLEGRTDGDALFFSRTLVVEGDMAAAVALRNAVDGAEISLVDDLTRPLGPLGGPARALARAGVTLYRRADKDLDTLRDALLSPVVRRCDMQDNRLRDLDETVSGLNSRKPARRA